MKYNDLGHYVCSEIERTQQLRAKMNVDIPLYVVMPNHIHLIICIDSCNNVKMSEEQRKFGCQSMNLASVISGIKSKITSYARKNGYFHFGWQSGYYDHVVRDNNELNLIAEYIETNVEKWSLDKYCIDL